MTAAHARAQSSIPQAVTILTAESPPKVLKEDIKTATTAVEAVNLATRKLTLRGSDGTVKDITVGEEVKNLPQVKVRDP